MFKNILRVSRLILVAALTLGVGALSAQGTSTWFDRLAQHKLGPARKNIESATFTCGHVKVVFTGSWAPILRDGQRIGYFLQGSGKLDYSSSYEPEWPVLNKNLKDWMRLDSPKVGQAQLVGFTFHQARLYFVGGQLPTWDGSEAPGLEEAHSSFDARWQKIDGFAPSHLLAAQAENLPARPLAILEMEGTNYNLLYRFDPLDADDEMLDCVQSFKQNTGDLKGWSYLLPLSRQPIGRDPRKTAKPVRFLLNALDVDVRTEDNRQVALAVQETLLPVQDGLRVLPFEFISDIITDKDHRHLSVTKVTDEQGNALEFSHHHDHLAIRLGKASRAGVPIVLKIEYQGDFLILPRGDNYWQLDVRGAWYPQPTKMAEESYTFHGTVRTKGEWFAFLPGDTERREKEGAWNLVETRTTQPICFATILGGKYFIDEETREGLTIRVATYAFKGGKSVKVIKDQAFNVLSYYKHFLGPYPFKELSIVEKNEWGYGQAPPGMTYITREAFEQISNIKNMQDFADLVGQYGGRVDFNTMDVRHVLAHELAHQYWGTVVKMGAPEDQWITESFADYCSALYERDYKGQGYYNRTLARWKTSAEIAHEAGPIPLANGIRRKDGFEGFRMRTGLLYAKGPLLLYSLHQELGDQVFLTWLKSIQSNFRWKFAPTKRIFDLLGFMTKKDYLPFYETYFWGTALPPIKK